MTKKCNLMNFSWRNKEQELALAKTIRLLAKAIKNELNLISPAKAGNNKCLKKEMLISQKIKSDRPGD